MIVKELAVNILELNGYRTRTEQLDTELKNFNKLKRESNFNQTSKDYNSISEKSEGIHSELEKLKSEMLQKIEDIHNLESELVKIEGHNTSSKQNSIQRNEEVMNEIRTMLKEMVNTDTINGASSLTVNKIYEEYSKTIRRITSSPTIHLKKIESDFIETGDIYRRFNQFRGQVEQDFCYLLNQAKDLENKLNTIENIDQSANEIEKFKNSVRITEDNFEKGKFYLFRELDNQCINNSNKLLINNLKSNIEKMLSDKHVELDSIINNFFSRLNNNSVRNSDSSFLTEEEDAIMKICERIRMLKAKIDSKSNKKDTEDADTKELMHLNDQIRILKSRMLAKGDQLNQMKKTASEAYQYQASAVPCPGPVFLPLNHIKRINPFDNPLNTYRIEPLELHADLNQPKKLYEFSHEKNTHQALTSQLSSWKSLRMVLGSSQGEL